jgi:hypothetical protein
VSSAIRGSAVPAAEAVVQTDPAKQAIRIVSAKHLMKFTSY